jgi:hypothetical protein
MKNKLLSSGTAKKYIKYMDEKKDLQNAIRMEIEFWGGYDKIPFTMKGDLHHRINALKKYAGEIHISAIEEKLARSNASRNRDTGPHQLRMEDLLP